MTLVEIALALDGDFSKPRPPSYSDAVGPVQVELLLQRRARMTPWEKLQATLEKRSQ